MSKPIYNIDNCPRSFNPEFLDAETYFIQKKGTSLCLEEVDNSDSSHDRYNIKRYHVKDPVYFAPIFGDGNCASRAVVLSLLMQGVLDDKQLFIAEKLQQIFRENKDWAKEIYDMDPPKDFDRFIEEYCALTPDKCAPFFKRFSSELKKNNKIFEFLMACLRLDMFDVCKNNYTDELVSTFARKEDFVSELNKLPVLKKFIDAEFLRFYLQNYHNISIDVYQIYEGDKELGPWFYSEDNNLHQDQRSQDLHLNIVFADDHFEVVVFKKDIDQYLERNKDKWLEKPLGCSLANSLPNGPSVINKKQTQNSITRVQKEGRKKKALDRRYKSSQPSNDPVFNKKSTKSSINRTQKGTRKKKVLDLRSQGFYESIKCSKEKKETTLKTLEKNKNKLLKKRLSLLKKHFRKGYVVNEKSTKSALQYLIKDLKSELMSQSLLGDLDDPAQRLLAKAQLILNNSDQSKDQLREDSKKIKKILIQHQKEKLNFYFEQKKMLKRLDLIEEYLSKQGKPTAFPSLKKYLKNEPASQSWHGAVDSLDRTLLDQAKLILMRSDESEKQLREDAKELRKIYKAYQQEKLKFSPGLLSNKKNDSCRQQANHKGINTDLFMGPKPIK